MPLQTLVGMAFYSRTLARIFYRKFELRILCRIANKRYAEVRRLSLLIGSICVERTPLWSGVQISTFNNMGYATDQEGRRIGTLCWNSPIGMTVYFGGQPYFGLGLELRGRVLCIRQMQGVQGAEPLQKMRDWPEMLVRACMAHAHMEGLKEVRVYKADQDIGWDFPDIEPAAWQSYGAAVEQHQSRMRRRYDRTATKLKFEKKKRYYVWKVPHTKPAT